MDALAKTNELPGVGPDVYEQWRGSSIGAITEALQRRLILDLLGNIRNIRGLRVLDIRLRRRLARDRAAQTGRDRYSDVGGVVTDTGLTFSGSRKRARRYFD